MPLSKVTIVSNNICYGPMPSPEDEVEQLELSVEPEQISLPVIDESENNDSEIQ